MANLIKNQVMKHLAKFFKNLSTDSFKLSTMKGFCELNNLELNEEVLMDLLELPVWLNISRATCSRAAIKIPWATLNKQPICLGLDEVNVQVEICENFRDLKNSVSLNQGSTSKYGWIDRVIDGIRITISSVVINFALSALSATFQIAQLEVESRPPNWKPCNDLRTTNFRDKDRGLVLNFKHIEWQTMKFEAKTESSAFSAPLRLICQGSCRLMMKKRLSDCQVVGARIMLVFNDLLWVLTDAMLVSAFHFVTYIFDLIKRAPINKKILEEPAPPKNISKLKMMVDNNAVKKYLEASKLFNFETSYHLVINCLQLQICDDLDPVHGRSSFASLSGGGALHVVIDKFVLDIYPYEKALGSRDNWLKYGDPSTTRDTWIRHHLFEFAERLANLPQNDLSSSRERKSAHQSLSDLYSMVILLRLGNYCVKTVSTSGSRRGGRKFGADTDERKFLTTGNFPGDLPALYVEFNQYYYYEYGSTRVSLSRPVPDPVIFANAVPLRLIVDLPTILWLNALQSNLEKSIADLKKILPQSESDTNMLVRIEALMPTISIDLKKPGNSSNLPIGTESGPFNQNAYGSMQLNCSKVVITNSVREASYLSRLNESLQKMGSCNFFTKRESFPWIDQIDSRPLANGFLKIMDSQNLNYHNQVWVIDCEPVWFDFIEKGSSRTVPIIDPIHATIWAYFSDSLLYDKQPESKESTVDCDVNMVLCIPEPVKISIEHDGYIFILRLMEKLEEFGSFISEDSLKIANFHGNEPMKSPRASIISLIPGIEIEVLLDRKEVHSDNSSMKTQYKPRTPNLPRDYINGSSSVDRVSSEQSLPQTSPSKSELSFKDPLMDPLRDNPSDSQPTPNFDYKSSSKESSGLTPSESSLTFSDLIPDLSPNDEDDRSIRSDLSADDELVIIGFGNLELEDDVYFTGNSIGVEKALEATELCVNESGDNPSNLTQVRSKPEILSLSYLTIKIGSLAFVKQSNGFHSSLLAKLSEIFINEFNNIPFNEYNDAKIGRNSKISNNDSLNVKNSSPENKNSSSIIMRSDSVLNPSLKSELMSIKIEDIEVSIDKDILLKLMDFLDDPFAEKVKPAIYHLQNVFFKIVDNNLKAPPLGMKFRDTLAEQTEDNIIRIIPSALNGSEHMLIRHSDSVRAGLGSSVDEKAKQMKKLESDTNELLSIIAAENSRLLSQIAELQLENERLRKNQSVTQED